MGTAPAPAPAIRRPPAPTLKTYFDEGAFDQAAARLRLQSLNIRTIGDFQVIDENNGVFNISLPAASFGPDSQHELMELAQRACAMKVGVSVVEVERNGMNALNLYVNVEHGKSSRAVSPGRAGGVKAFASNIDVHGVRGIQAGYQKDQPQQQQQQQQQQP